MSGAFHSPLMASASSQFAAILEQRMNPESSTAAHHQALNKMKSKLSTTEKGSSIVLLWALIVGALTGFVGALFQIALARIATLKEILLRFLEFTPGLPIIGSIVISGGN